MGQISGTGWPERSAARGADEPTCGTPQGGQRLTTATSYAGGRVRCQNAGRQKEPISCSCGADRTECRRCLAGGRSCQGAGRRC